MQCTTPSEENDRSEEEEEEVVVGPTAAEVKESEMGGTEIGWRTRGLGEGPVASVPASDCVDETESGWDLPCGAEGAVASCSREAVGTSPWKAFSYSTGLVEFDLGIMGDIVLDCREQFGESESCSE